MEAAVHRVSLEEGTEFRLPSRLTNASRVLGDTIIRKEPKRCLYIHLWITRHREPKSAEFFDLFDIFKLRQALNDFF